MKSNQLPPKTLLPAEKVEQVTMRPRRSSLPDAGTYEQEYQYWPWGQLLTVAASWVEANALPGAIIVDYMCGTGFLLNQIVQRRPDLKVSGCSITPDFIRYAHEAYRGVDVTLCDALEFKPELPPDIVLCTAGIHHLTRMRQPVFLEKVASELSRGTYFVVGEEVIRPYHNEGGRKQAVHEMWSALVSYLIEADAPQDIVRVALSVELDDLYEISEYKLSLPNLVSMLKRWFNIEEVHHVWPKKENNFGDVLLICCRI